jgi:hypothetical protein
MNENLSTMALPDVAPDERYLVDCAQFTETSDGKSSTRRLRTKAWSASAVLHVAAALLMLILSFERPNIDFITVEYAAEPVAIELAVELAPEPPLSLDELLEEAPVEVAEVLIQPPEARLTEPVEHVHLEEIRNLVQKSLEQAKQLPPEKQMDSLEWLLEVDEKVVSDDSAQEITNLVKQALAVDDREYEPGTPCKISEIDYDTVVPYYRITQKPSEIIQIIDLNPNGDYRIVKQADFYELYDAEVEAYQEYMRTAPEDLDAFLEEKMLQEVPDLESTAETTRHFRPTRKPAGRYFQILHVDGAGRYRISEEKPEAEMNLLERLRMKAFQLTENPKHRQYREAVLGAAGSND